MKVLLESSRGQAWSLNKWLAWFLVPWGLVQYLNHKEQGLDLGITEAPESVVTNIPCSSVWLGMDSWYILGTFWLCHPGARDSCEGVDISVGRGWLCPGEGKLFSSREFA